MFTPSIDTTLTGLVRDYLQRVAAENAVLGRKRRERDALDRTFTQFQFKIRKPTWTRDVFAHRKPE